MTTTLVAAMIARAHAGGVLFTVLSLPLLLPLLIFLIQGTSGAVVGNVVQVTESIRATVALGGALTVVSVWLFPVVWRG